MANTSIGTPICTPWWPTVCSCARACSITRLRDPTLASSRWKGCSGRGSSSFSWTRASCRQSARTCCVAGYIPASTCTAHAASYRMRAKTWSVWPSTSSATRSPSRKCRLSRPTGPIPTARSSTVPASTRRFSATSRSSPPAIPRARDRDHPTHPGQELPTRSLLWLV